MALTLDHRFLVIGDTTANEMLFLDPANGTVERRITITDPYQFGYSPDGKWLVVNGLLVSVRPPHLNGPHSTQS